jgi:hypothetical protein
MINIVLVAVQIKAANYSFYVDQRKLSSYRYAW